MKYSIKIPCYFSTENLIRGFFEAEVEAEDEENAKKLLMDDLYRYCKLFPAQQEIPSYEVYNSDVSWDDIKITKTAT